MTGYDGGGDSVLPLLAEASQSGILDIRLGDNGVEV